MNPADHITITKGGVDQNPSFRLPAGRTGTPSAASSASGLVVEDNGGGPAAGHLQAPVAVHPNLTARAIEDNALGGTQQMPRAEIARTPVNKQVNEWLDAAMGATPTPPVPVPITTPPAVVTPPQTPALPASAVAAASNASVALPPTSVAARANAPLQRTEADVFWEEIQAEIVRLQYATGQIVLDDPSKCDPANAVHVAIWNMRYNTGLIQMDGNVLCLYEAALSSHQAWVAGIENWWTARYDFLGPELSKILRQRRGKYNGATEKAKEDAVCDNEPDVERLRHEWVKAKAIATYLKGFGDRFAQLENGIKRAVNQAQERERREGRGSRQTA